MKKLLALLLVLTLVFSFTLSLTACGESKDECTEHVDENNDGKCDKCEEDMPNPENPGTNPENPGTNPENPGTNPAIPADKLGETISAAVIAQLNAASSVKLEMEASAIMSQTLEGAAAADSMYTDDAVKVTVVVSKTQTGVNAKVDVSLKSKAAADGEYGPAKEFTALYLVDGVAYIYDEEEEGYYAEELTAVDAEQITSVLEVLFEGVDLITDDDIAAIKKALGDLFVETFTVDGNKATLSFDAKPAIDSLLAYIAALDPDTKTVEALANDILALVNKDLTVTALLTEVKRVAGLTVNEAVAEIDAWLTENYETTLQGMYNTIVTNEDFVQLTKNLLKIQGMTDEAEVTAIITQIQSVNFAQLLKTPIAEGVEAGNVELITLISMFAMATPPGDVEVEKVPGNEEVGQNPEPTSDTETVQPETPAAPDADAMIEQVFGMVEAFLPLTLTQVNTQFYPDMQIVPLIKQYAATVTVNALNDKITVNFADGYNISTIEGEYNVDVKVVMPAGAPGANGTMVMKMKTTFKLYDLSANAVEIKLPENIVIIEEGIPSDPEDLALLLKENNFTIKDEETETEFDGLVATVNATRVSVGSINSVEMISAYYFESVEAAKLAYDALFAMFDTEQAVIACEVYIEDTVVYVCTKGVLEILGK